MDHFFTPTIVLGIAVAFLFIGLILGWCVCALLNAASNADDQLEIEEILMHSRIPVLWRYRNGDSMRWLYTEDERDIPLVPRHWQVQSYGLIANMVDLDGPYTRALTTAKEPA